jgi:hypothetical protein
MGAPDALCLFVAEVACIFEMHLDDAVGKRIGSN